MGVKYFNLNNVKLKLENYELYYWFYKTNRGHNIKKPFWRKKKLNKKTGGYLRCIVNNKHFLFHRIVYLAYNPNWNIYDNSDNNSIDHIDINPLNNNIFNLRIATRREQNMNRNLKSGKGYSYDKRAKKYKAWICINKKIYLGLYNTEQEASNKAQKVRLFVKVLKIILKRKKIK
jgi:hypothetical protein